MDATGQDHAASATAPVAAAPPVALTQEEHLFHKNFPNVPPNEKLVEDYQCSLIRNKIMRVGRLFLTSARLCFFAPFPRESLMIEWEQVASIEKKSNMLIDAVIVTTVKKESHFFTAFTNSGSESAQKVMQMLLNMRAKMHTSHTEASAAPASATATAPQAAAAAAAASAVTITPKDSPAVAAAAKPAPVKEEKGIKEEEVAGDAALQASFGHDVDPITQHALVPEKSGAEGNESQDVAAKTQAPPTTDTPAHLTPPLREASPSKPRGASAERGQAQSPTNRAMSPTKVPSGSFQRPASALQNQPQWPQPTAQPTIQPCQSKGSQDTSFDHQDAPPERSETEEPVADVSQVSDQDPKVCETKAPSAAPASYDTKPPIAESNARTTPQKRLSADLTTSASGRHNAEILKHFPALDPSERIIDSFQCSFVLGVQRIGKLHITTSHVLFTSVLMSEGVCIALCDIKSVEKLQNLLVFDGISITTTKSDKPFEFTSFVNRDAAFSIVQQLLASHKHEAGPPSAEEGNKADLPVPSGAECEAPKATSEQDAACASTEAELRYPPFASCTADPNLTLPEVDTLDAFDTYSTDYGTLISHFSNFKKQLFPPLALPEGYSLRDIFRCGYDDGAPLVPAYHDDHKDTNLVIEPWRAIPGKPNSGQRRVRLTTIVRALIKTSAPYLESSKYAMMSHKGVPALLVHLSSQVHGVPFGDSFVAERILVYREETPGHLTFTVFGYVQFTKGCIIKGHLSNLCMTEMAGTYHRYWEIACDILKKQKPLVPVRGIPAAPRQIAVVQASIQPSEVGTSQAAVASQMLTRGDSSPPFGVPAVAAPCSSIYYWSMAMVVFMAAISIVRALWTAHFAEVAAGDSCLSSESILAELFLMARAFVVAALWTSAAVVMYVWHSLQ